MEGVIAGVMSLYSGLGRLFHYNGILLKLADKWN